MDEEQRYLFDTRGVFTIPGALSPGQVRELNRIFDEVEREQDGRMAGDALHWGAAYRELLDLPHISPILEELIGNRREDRVSEAAAKGGIPTFRIDHINVHNRCKGANHPHFTEVYDGSSLHGGGLGNSGNHGGGGSQFFRYQDGAFFNGLTVIAFELQDTHCNGGGFCCVSAVHGGARRFS